MCERERGGGGWRRGERIRLMRLTLDLRGDWVPLGSSRTKSIKETSHGCTCFG